MQARLGLGDVLRKVLGVAALLAVVAIGLGWDTGLLTRLSTVSTARIEQSLLDAVPGAQPAAPPMMMAGANTGADAPLPVEGTLPALDGATGWLNSPPLTAQQLRGKVVLVDFWTYSCINCLRAMPFVHEWERRYRDHGLVVIGVHTPEFPFERSTPNVQKALERFKITYPVAQDNRYATWEAYRNQYWPAVYLIDKQGQIVYRHFGEGNYAETEAEIQRLLAQPGSISPPEAIDTDPADWTTGRLQFDRLPLAEVLRILQRYHDRPIVLDDPTLGPLQVSGVFDADRADTAVALLPEILPVQVHAAADGSLHLRRRD
ncbi:hypothetical protein G6F68_010476 [Rhizopus microsporus]|nr:hypothetical protein G6F68_010476 [Rhizopus microsporus]